tara:strand:+ start:1161 stop:1460 length:300 start_codon:yes stop_codon:yes gene_type:complete
MELEPVKLGIVLEQLLTGLGSPEIKAITSLVDQWEDVVGPELAIKVSAVAVKGSELIVRVDDPAWANQISWLEQQILLRIDSLIGANKITSLHVQVDIK